MDIGKAYTPSSDILSRPLVNGTGGNTAAYESVMKGGKSRRKSKRLSRRKTKKNISRKNRHHMKTYRKYAKQ
jgi:hypothetical protein